MYLYWKVNNLKRKLQTVSFTIASKWIKYLGERHTMKVTKHRSKRLEKIQIKEDIHF